MPKFLRSLSNNEMTSSDPFLAVKRDLEHVGIIPDVIPGSFNPSVLLSVMYDRAPGTGPIRFGAEVYRDKLLEEPRVLFEDLKYPEEEEVRGVTEKHEKATYTLVMTDPDAPSRAQPRLREWRHWVIPGLKATTPGADFTKTKASFTPYYPPTPPAGTGPHRYTFLLFREPPGGYTVSDNAAEKRNTPSERGNWNAWKFAESNGLQFVGATYYTVEKK